MAKIKNTILNNKEMEIFRIRSDAKTKVGTIKFNEKNMKSETEMIIALNDSIKNLEDGMYAVHPNDGLFARFKLENHTIQKLEKLSENTGITMPCWKHFEE